MPWADAPAIQRRMTVRMRVLTLNLILSSFACSHHKSHPSSGGAVTAAGGGGGGMRTPIAGTTAGTTGAPRSGTAGSSAGTRASGGAGVGDTAGVIGTAGAAGVAGDLSPSAAGHAGGSGSGAIAGTHGAVPGCTTKPGARRGKSVESVMVGSTKRTFVYYAPDDLDPHKPVPLVIVPHGYTQSGDDMFTITKYPMLAEREGFIAIFPDGAPNSTGPWDVGKNVCGNGALVPGNGDDQTFIDLMIEFAAEDRCLDRDHIYMTGWSMGGYLSNHSGCLRDDLRAIGPHSAGSHDLSACTGKRKPVILFHFDPDNLIDYSCGESARDGWVKHNGCQLSDPDITQVQGGSCEYYKGCPSDGQVAFCTFQIPPAHENDFLSGHAWSGGTTHAYSIEQTQSAAELGFSFFKQYAW